MKTRYIAIRLRKELKKAKQELFNLNNSSYLDDYDKEYIPYLECNIIELKVELINMGVR